MNDSQNTRRTQDGDGDTEMGGMNVQPSKVTQTYDFGAAADFMRDLRGRGATEKGRSFESKMLQKLIDSVRLETQLSNEQRTTQSGVGGTSTGTTSESKRKGDPDWVKGTGVTIRQRRD